MTQQRHHPKTVAAKQAVAGKAAAATLTGKPGGAQELTEEQRHRMIAEAAYLIAEQRGFQGDLALQDWLQAETQVSARFAARH